MADRGEGNNEPPPVTAPRRVAAGPASSTTAVDDVRPGSSRTFDLGALTALGAVLASVTYVLLNSAYLEFYRSLGIRPEDVGLDRLAILGRAFGLLLIALLIWALSLGFYVTTWLSQDARRRLRRRLHLRLREERPWERAQQSIRWRIAAPAIALCVAFGLVSVAVSAATVAVKRRAESVEAGTPVGPLRVGPLLLIDVNAAAARAYWLEKDLPRPELLDDPWLLYLGSSDRVAVFIACGTTVIVPADKVIPELLTTQDIMEVLRGDEAERKAVCATREP